MSENLPTNINYDDPKMVATLKATVARGASEEEFLMFSQFCRATGLNPFKKEIWFIKPKAYRNKQGEMVDPPVQMMTGIAGFLAIANSHPQFDGMECEVTRDEKTGKPIKATAKAYRKDRKYPSIGEAWFNEYYKPGWNGRDSIWDKLPTPMISKVAKSIALREAFPQELNGLYTEEEMPLDFSEPVPKTPNIQPAQKPSISLQVETTTAIGEGRAYQYDTKRAGEQIAPDQKKIMLGRLEKQYGLVFQGGFGYTSKPIPEWSQYLMNDANEQPVVAEKPKNANKDKRALAKAAGPDDFGQPDDIPEDWGKEADEYAETLGPNRFEVK